MTEDVLFVFNSAPPSKKLDSVEEGGRVFLCPLTSDQEVIERVKNALESKNKEVELLDFPTLFHETAFASREDYITFIADFGDRRIIDGKDLKEYFKMPGEDFSLWWFSLIAEKNTLKTPAFHTLVQFLTIKRIQEDLSPAEIWTHISDDSLNHTICDFVKSGGIVFKDLRGRKSLSHHFYLFTNFINTVIYFSYFILKTILVKIGMRRLDGRGERLSQSRYLLVSYFPHAVEEQLQKNKFVNKYYQPLQLALEKRYPERYSWLAMMMKFKGQGIRNIVKLGRSVNSWGENMFFLEEWISPKDIAYLLLNYFLVTTRFLMKIPRLSDEFRYPEGNIKIWTLFKNDWYSSFAGWTLFEGMIFYRAFQNISSELGDVTVVYPAEMHAWEKALNIAADARGLKTVGVQHTIVPLLLLNYFNHTRELEPGDLIEKVPRPGFLACVGDVTMKLFIETGWDRERVFSWGAIRFLHYKEPLKSEIPWNERKNTVVVALSISPSESREVIQFVYQAYKDQKEYQVLLKGHPILPVEPMLNSLKITESENFRIVKSPLGELLKTAKAMVVTESSSSLESIANQCPVIVPYLSGTVDMNPLSGISSLPFYAKSPKDLRKITDQIMENEESPITYVECREFIERYCYFPNSDDDFLNRLEKLGQR